MSFSPLYIFMCVTIRNSVYSLSLSFLGIVLIIVHSTHLTCLPRWLSSKESACQCRRHKRHGFNPWVGKIPWGERLLTPVFWPGEFHGLYSPWDHKELDTTEWLSHCLKSVYPPPVACGSLGWPPIRFRFDSQILELDEFWIAPSREGRRNIPRWVL